MAGDVQRLSRDCSAGGLHPIFQPRADQDRRRDPQRNDEPPRHEQRRPGAGEHVPDRRPRDNEPFRSDRDEEKPRQERRGS